MTSLRHSAKRDDMPTPGGHRLRMETAHRLSPAQRYEILTRIPRQRMLFFNEHVSKRKRKDDTTTNDKSPDLHGQAHSGTIPPGSAEMNHHTQQHTEVRTSRTLLRCTNAGVCLYACELPDIHAKRPSPPLRCGLREHHTQAQPRLPERPQQGEVRTSGTFTPSHWTP